MTEPLHLVHTESSDGWGGQEMRILAEVRGLLERGHQVTILCPEYAPLFAEAGQLGLPVVGMPIGRKGWSGLTTLRGYLQTHPTRIINTHSSADHWLAAAACRLLTQPPVIVRTRHISAPVTDNAPTRWLYLSATRRIVTTGEAIRQQMIQRNRFPAERVVSIPTGIDLGRFRPGDRLAARRALGLPEEGFLIGIVATLRSWKGHADLIDAFKLMSEPGVRLLLVGEGPQRDNIVRQIAQRGLVDRVTLTGQQGDVVPWMQSLDLFVLPSYANEGVPQAMMQALACGLSVLSTPVGGIPEVVTDGVNGLLVPARQPEVLAQAMTRLIRDEVLRHRLASTAAVGAERFGLAVMLDRMEALFRQVSS